MFEEIKSKFNKHANVPTEPVRVDHDSRKQSRGTVGKHDGGSEEIRQSRTSPPAYDRHPFKQGFSFTSTDGFDYSWFVLLHW